MNNDLVPHRESWESVAEHFGVSPDDGLSNAEAKKRLDTYGPNQLREHKRKSPWAILLDQLKSLVVMLLLAACALSFVLGEFTEGFAVAAVIAINTAIGFITEIKATRSMEALFKLGAAAVRVRRHGQTEQIPASDLVPGDIVVLEGGDVISADLRLVEASRIQCDESALTGESVPVGKDPAPVEEAAPLAERKNMLYKGTALTRGSGAAIVVATGMDTELGQISTLVEGAQGESTPLEQRLDALGRNLVWVVLVITAAVGGLGILRGKDVFLMLETAIALAVASIPEGLPVVATIALSRGMLRMARRHALVRRLASVETLGSTNVICTDKTGTLTENRMTVTRIELPAGALVRRDDRWFKRDDEPVDWSDDTLAREAVMIGVLCNNASVRREQDGETTLSGDPLEAALLVAGLDAGIERDELVEEYPEIGEEAFDSVSKMMATYHEKGQGVYVAVKGAPEAVLEASAGLLTTDGERELTGDLRDEWRERNERLARNGLRVLAVARRRLPQAPSKPYEELVLVGLIGMEDPPRGDVRASIDRCKKAGIRVVMVTGDQPLTAAAIAADLRIGEPESSEVVHGKDLKLFDHMSSEEKERLRRTHVFARMNPRQKLDLISLHQEAGDVVAMTGDGVNDAPALKKADIGVAMGRRGTQVACEAADVVLQDDSFKTIVYAVQEGRVIFGNIQAFVMYLLSCNIGEVLVIFLASVVNTPLPILPLQILLLNVVTDVFPALALGVGEGNEQVMRHPPRRREKGVLSGQRWAIIAFYGFVLSVCTLAAFLIAYGVLEMGREASVTVGFLTLAFSQLFHVFDMREAGADMFGNRVTRNPYVWGALVLCTVILLVVVYVPPVSAILHTEPLGLTGWLIVVPFSIAPVFVDLLARLVWLAFRRPQTP